MHGCIYKRAITSWFNVTSTGLKPIFCEYDDVIKTYVNSIMTSYSATAKRLQFLIMHKKYTCLEFIISFGWRIKDIKYVTTIWKAITNLIFKVIFQHPGIRKKKSSDITLRFVTRIVCPYFNESFLFSNYVYIPLLICVLLFHNKKRA